MSLSKTQIIQRAREITGNKEDRSPAETTIPDAAIEADLKSAIRELNSAFGATSNSAQKDVMFTATAGIQDYDITLRVGTDVYRIEEVWRSSCFTPDFVLFDDRMRINGTTGFNATNAAVIQPGMQSSVFRTIIEMARSERADRQGGWEQAPGNILRLMPPPLDAEIIAVRYIASAFSIETLPDEAEQALVYAACVSILDASINRIASDKVTHQILQVRTTDQRIKMLADQRTRYEALYEAELNGARA